MRTPAAVAATIAVLALGACASGELPADDTSAEPTTSSATAEPSESAPAEGVVVDVRIAGGEVTPQGKRVEVGVGEPITLNVTTDEADEIHVHSDPEESLDVAAGETKDLTFSVDTPGQVAVESHHLDVTIVQLVVRP